MTATLARRAAGEFTGAALLVTAVVGSGGLLLLPTFALARTGRSRATPAAVGAFIAAAYRFAAEPRPRSTIGARR